MEQRDRDLRERIHGRRERHHRDSPRRSLRSRSRSPNARRSTERVDYVGPWRRRGEPHRPGDHSESLQPRTRTDSDRSSSAKSTQSRGEPPKASGREAFVKETDPVILARRQKQLDYGKNTLCYQEYIKAVPKNKRENYHPRTPVKLRRTSRRRWDSAIKNWRIQLHYWNDPVKLAQLRAKDTDSETSERTDAATPECKEDADIQDRLSKGDVKLGPTGTPSDSLQVKPEPDGAKPDSVKVKLEPGVEEHGTCASATAAAAMKQEPDSDPPSSPEKHCGFSEPEDSENEDSSPQNERSQYLEEHADDHVLDWAADLEGLADELAL